MSVSQMVRMILDMMGSSTEPTTVGTAQNEIRHQYLDASKARDVLGWKPAFSLGDGLKITVEWYRELFGMAPGTFEQANTRPPA